MLPRQMKLFHSESHLEIVRSWLGGLAIFLAVFLILSVAIVCAKSPVWYPKLATLSGVDLIGIPIAAIAAIGFTYYVVANLINRTHILVSREKLTVQHKPMPWPGNQQLEISNLTQLYVYEKYRNSQGASQATSHEVRAIFGLDQHVTLIGHLANTKQASFIEREIEKFLKLQNVPVAGEGPVNDFWR